MKTILFYFLLAILAVSCQSKQSENTEKEVSDNVSNSDTEECSPLPPIFFSVFMVVRQA